jgi:hypothetical protein
MPPPGTMMWIWGWCVRVEASTSSAPGVKHRGDADTGAEVLGIGRDGGHGLGRGREQDVIDYGLVPIGDVRDGGRYPPARSVWSIRQLNPIFFVRIDVTATNDRTKPTLGYQ